MSSSICTSVKAPCSVSRSPCKPFGFDCVDLAPVLLVNCNSRVSAVIFFRILQGFVFCISINLAFVPHCYVKIPVSIFSRSYIRLRCFFLHFLCIGLSKDLCRQRNKSWALHDYWPQFSYGCWSKFRPWSRCRGLHVCSSEVVQFGFIT